MTFIHRMDKLYNEQKRELKGIRRVFEMNACFQCGAPATVELCWDCITDSVKGKWEIAFQQQQPTHVKCSCFNVYDINEKLCRDCGNYNPYYGMRIKDVFPKKLLNEQEDCKLCGAPSNPQTTILCTKCGYVNPKYKKQEMFCGGEAIKRIKQGKKCKRKHWGGYWFMPNRGPKFFDGKIGLQNMNPMIIAKLKDDGGYVPATPYQEDMLAEDWIEVDE